jgi:magnesium chelatase family protein
MMTSDYALLRDMQRLRQAVQCAVGGGHVLLVGPPGSGKTMLTRRMAALLPAMAWREHMELALIWGCCMGLAHLGSPSFDDLKAGRRPFRAPHHTVSAYGLGGHMGSASPWETRRGLHPGEVSLAHSGILFLDDMEEFSRPALDRLIEPLVDGQVTFGTRSARYILPAKFTLVAAVSDLDVYERRVPEPVRNAFSTVCIMPEAPRCIPGAVSQLCNEIDALNGRR